MLYTKTNGKFIPVELDTVLTKELNGKLVIVRVGNDKVKADAEDIDATVESFSQANVLDGLDFSLIITPYQIQVEVLDENELKDKNIYIQIKDGDDISWLDEITKKYYNNTKHKGVNIIPGPLKVKEYRQAQETLERSKMRKAKRFK